MSRDRRHRRFLWLTLGGAVALVTTALASVLVGSSALGLRDVLAVYAAHLPGATAAVDPVNDAIVWSLRTPRVVLGAMVGAALALAGAQMQGLFRNALASPDIVGTSAGASLGAVITLATGLSVRSLFYLPIFAIAGAILALLVVARIASRDSRTPIATLLLAGVALTIFIGAINSWIIGRSWEQFEAARRIAYWLLGGIADRGWVHVALIAPGLLVGVVLALLYARDLDLLLEGEETASALGVEVERAKRRVLFNAGLLTGSAVAVSGQISFVGLVVPHIVRLLLGPAHRRLIPAAAISGAWFVVAADLVARTVAAPTEIHLGVVTSLVGAPFFLFLLVRYRRETVEL